MHLSGKGDETESYVTLRHRLRNSQNAVKSPCTPTNSVRIFQTQSRRPPIHDYPLQKQSQMRKTDALKKTAPFPRVAIIIMLLSMVMLLAPKTDAAIVDGDFESTADLSGPIATATLATWSPTNSVDGTTLVVGTDPYFHNSVFNSLVSAGGGTTGGSISALFLTSPAGYSPANSMASISQNVATTPGKFYDIRLWVANISTDINGQGDAGARENLFSVTWDGNLVDLSAVDPVHFAAPNPANPNAVELAGATGTYVLTATGGWTLVTFQKQASGATTTLTISAQNNNNATAVDAVDVVETPEPSSVILLAAGAAIAGLRRRRAQRIAL